jgi:4'-phosphopantetheinyl transferase EntD
LRSESKNIYYDSPNEILWWNSLPFKWMGITKFMSERDLTFAEQKIVSHAHPRRKLEFATGRWCARKVLRLIGSEPSDILISQTGAPSVPSGLLLSISHCQGLICAAASTDKSFIGIGTDVHHTMDIIEDEAWARICHRMDLIDGCFPESNLSRILIFSAKEAAWKCLQHFYPKPVNLADIAICIESNKLSINAFYDINNSNSPFPLLCLEGQYFIWKDSIGSAVYLRKD